MVELSMLELMRGINGSMPHFWNRSHCVELLFQFNNTIHLTHYTSLLLKTMKLNSRNLKKHVVKMYCFTRR